MPVSLSYNDQTKVESANAAITPKGSAFMPMSWATDPYFNPLTKKELI